MDFKAWILWTAVALAALGVVLTFAKWLDFFSALPWPVVLLCFVPVVVLVGVIVIALLQWMADGAP